MFAVVFLAVATAGGLVVTGRSAVDEAVADMNHAVHIARDLECVDCHTGVETHAAAGVPAIAICAECHDDPEYSMVRSENGKHILAHVLKGEEPWWPSVHALPDHVVFSHRRHVAIGKIDCKECHGNMESATTLPVEPVRGILTMDGCMECHERSGASLHCAACHK